MNNKEESWLYALRFRQSRLAWVILFLTLLVVFGLWRLSIVLVEDKTRAHFETQSQQLKTAIEERLLNYEQVLAGSAGLFAVADLVGRHDWRTYVNKLDIERYYPGIQGLGYTERVASEGVSEHIERIRAQGLPDYLLSPDGNQTEYHPVVFLEPSTQRNRRAFGFDAYGDPSHRAAMQRSRDRGEVSMTGRIVLVQETLDEEQAGFVMYYPVYRYQNNLESVTERREALSGFVFSAFRMNNLMDGIVGLIAPFLDVKIYDSDVPVKDALMYASNLGSLEDDYTFSMSLRLEHGGRTWLLVTQTTPAFDYLSSDPRPHIVLIAGVIVSLLLFLITLILQRSRLVAQSNAGKYRAITEGNCNVTLILAESGDLSFVSPSTERLLGYGLVDLNKIKLERIIHKDDRERFATQLVNIARGYQTSVAVEARLQARDGCWKDMKGSLINMIDVSGVQGIVVNLRDVTAQRNSEIALDYHRSNDFLTGLPNRQTFIKDLSLYVSEAGSRNRQALLVFLDVDGFRLVNNSLGLEAGDLLLKSVSQWLLQCVRPSDFIARLGGDEFALLLTDTGSGLEENTLLDQVLASVHRVIHLGEHELFVSASAGVVRIPNDSENSATLMKFASLAMSKAKILGRNGYHFYNSSLNIGATRKMLMQAELHSALEHHQFVLRYRPVLSAAKQTVIAIEAILVWNHPERGNVASEQFWEVAEESGLIESLGYWKLVNACRQAVALNNAGFDQLIMRIKISPLQLMSVEFANTLKKLIREIDITPSLLELVLPSSVLSLPQASVAESIRDVSRLGVQLSIADIGLISVTQLSELPFRSVTLNAAFIKGLPNDRKQAEVMEVITNLVKMQGCKILGEGVETRAQFEFLAGCSVDYVQGGFFSPTLDEEQLSGYLLNMAEEQKDRFI